jgi:hypothetical protein
MLYSNCCNAPDRLFRRVLDMSHADMGICPTCGEHADFSNPDIIEELTEVTKGQKDLISITIRHGIKSEPHMSLFEYIKSQAKDNIRLMEQVIGIELTNKILAL